MTLAVRDEADVIDAHLAFHLSRGVAGVLVTDHRCTDGTSERLAAWAAADPRVHVVREDGAAFDQGALMTAMARRAAGEHRADWVLHGDADEFAWPLSDPDLPRALGRVPARCGAVRLPRWNFAARPGDGRPFHERMIFRETASTDELGRPLRPKVAHRAFGRATVVAGSHAVGTGRPWRTPVCERPVIALLHFPRRSLAQYEHKTRVGAAAPGYDHKSLRAAAADQVAGRLAARYAERFEVGDAALARGLADGSLVEDVRLRDALRALLSRS